MTAALFPLVPYIGSPPKGVWPYTAAAYSSEAAKRSMQFALEQFELADRVGFDWVTVAEHHYAPMSLTPSPTVMAGALTQRVKRAHVLLAEQYRVILFEVPGFGQPPVNERSESWSTTPATLSTRTARRRSPR